MCMLDVPTAVIAGRRTVGTVRSLLAKTGRGGGRPRPEPTISKFQVSHVMIFSRELRGPAPQTQKIGAFLVTFTFEPSSISRSISSRKVSGDYTDGRTEGGKEGKGQRQRQRQRRSRQPMAGTETLRVSAHKHKDRRRWLLLFASLDTALPPIASGPAFLLTLTLTRTGARGLVA